MNIEIHKPELEALILHIMKTEPSGTIEDVLFKALKRRDHPVISTGALGEADAEPVEGGKMPDEAAIEEIRKTSTVSSPPPMTAQERGRRFMEWAQSHADDDAPLLSDEAVSRASFYSDRW